MAHLLFCCPTNILINSILIDTKINLKRTHKVVALLKSHTSTLFQTSSAFHKTKNWVGLEKNVTCESDITNTMFLFLHIATHFLHKSTHPRERCPIMATPMFLHKAWCISLDKLKPNILCVQGIPAPPRASAIPWDSLCHSTIYWPSQDSICISKDCWPFNFHFSRRSFSFRSCIVYNILQWQTTLEINAFKTITQKWPFKCTKLIIINMAFSHTLNLVSREPIHQRLSKVFL